MHLVQVLLQNCDENSGRVIIFLCCYLILIITLHNHATRYCYLVSVHSTPSLYLVFHLPSLMMSSSYEKKQLGSNTETYVMSSRKYVCAMVEGNSIVSSHASDAVLCHRMTLFLPESLWKSQPLIC